MDIVKHIIEILKTREQVVVPGLGSFFKEYKSAGIHPVDHTFTPPQNIIVFDSFTPEDDMFIKWIADKENVGSEEAQLAIRDFTDELVNRIQSEKRAKIEGFGEFILQFDNTISFTCEINDIQNESFGLEEFTSQAINKNEFKEKAEREIQKAKDFELARQNRKKKTLIIAAVIIFIFLVFLVFFTDFIKVVFLNDNVKMERPNQQMVIQKPVENPVVANQNNKDTLTTINKKNATELQIKEKETPIEKKTVIPAEKAGKEAVKGLKENQKEIPKVAINEVKKETNKFFLVAGSFKIEENAKKRVEELKAKGYKNAGITQQTQKGLFVVFYEAFKTKVDADKAHIGIKKSENPESWIMKK